MVAEYFAQTARTGADSVDGLSRVANGDRRGCSGSQR
jgi:hypothetical protein